MGKCVNPQNQAAHRGRILIYFKTHSLKAVSHFMPLTDIHEDDHFILINEQEQISECQGL